MLNKKCASCLYLFTLLVPFALHADPRITFRILSSGTIETQGIGPKLPCVAKAANGDILVQFNSGSDQWPGSTAYMVRSTDEGRTWEPPYKIVESPLPDGGVHTNIGLTVLPNGDILVPFTHGVLIDGWRGYPSPNHTGQKWVHPYVVISKDNGKTFGPWIVIPGMEMASAYGRIVTASNGKLLFTMWAFYNWTSTAAFPSNAHSGYAMSHDQGRTWGGDFVDVGPYGETSIIELNTGGFLAVGKMNGSNLITRFAYSNNIYVGHWEEITADYNTSGKNTSLHLSPKGTPLVFLSSGNIKIRYSLDDGESWKEAIVILTGGYGISAANLDGSRMILTYHAQDESIQETGSSPWLTSKTRLGFTILEEVRIDIPDSIPEQAHKHKSRNFFKQAGRVLGVNE